MLALTLELGEVDAEGETLALMEDEGETLALTLELGDRDADGETLALTLELGETDADGDREDDGEIPANGYCSPFPEL